MLGPKGDWGFGLATQGFRELSWQNGAAFVRLSLSRLIFARYG
jgi:hypothetical protein